MNPTTKKQFENEGEALIYNIIHKGGAEKRSFNMLARLLTAIFKELRITPTHTYQMLMRWSTNPANGYLTKDTQSTARSNFKKELTNPQVTWRTIEKLATMLNPASIKLTMEFTWHDGTKTCCSIANDVLSSDKLDAKAITQTLIKSEESLEILTKYIQEQTHGE